MSPSKQGKSITFQQQELELLLERIEAAVSMNCEERHIRSDGCKCDTWVPKLRQGIDNLLHQERFQEPLCEECQKQVPLERDCKVHLKTLNDPLIKEYHKPSSNSPLP